MNWFKPQVKIEYRVLEVDKAPHLAPLTPELKDSLRALQLHPGWQYLMARLTLERANLEKYLREGFKLTEKELNHLQTGVYYTGWLRSECDRLTAVPRRAEAPLSLDDQQLFEELQSQLEVIS